MSETKQTRRAFIIGGAAVAATAALGFAARPFIAEADVLRPPGSVAEADFVARCIRCSRCISVCPTNILEPMGIEEGFVPVQTPRISFADNLCTFCDECKKVCPTAAIGAVDPLAPSKGRIGVAVLHDTVCLAFLELNSCGICVDACPYDALSFDEQRRPVVDDKLCNGCGECVRICPAHVSKSFSGGSTRGIEVITEKSYTAIAGEGK